MMKKSLSIVLVLVTQIMLGQSIITDRPDQTESSSTVQRGKLQVETGILIGYTEDESSSVRQLLLPTTLFRYGLTKGIELRLLNQWESIKDKQSDTTIDGISDIELGVKLQLFQKDSVNTEIAFLSHMVLPTGSKGLSNDKLGTINKLSISHGISDKIGLGYNIGYNYFGSGSGNLTYSMALGISLSDTVGIYIEPYGEVVDFNEHLANFDTGFTYLIKDNVQLDFSFGTGINYTMNYMSIGCSFSIPN